jgi:hypothetical protein
LWPAACRARICSTAASTVGRNFSPSSIKNWRKAAATGSKRRFGSSGKGAAAPVAGNARDAGR